VTDLAVFLAAEQPTLARAVARYCGDVDVADDAAGEALARCCARWDEVGSMRSPGGWTSRCARNLAADVFRRRAAEQRALARHGPSRPVDLDPVDVDVRAAVGRLPVEQRRAVLLRFYLGHTTRETATVMGRTDAAVRSLVHRALVRLRRDPALAGQSAGGGS